jgi:WD40 repeat protein
MRTHVFAMLVVVSGLADARPASAQVLKETAALPGDDAAIVDLTMDGESRWLAALGKSYDNPRSSLRFWDLQTRKRIDPPKDAKPKAEEDNGFRARFNDDEPRGPLQLTRSGILAFVTGNGVRLHRFDGEPPHVSKLDGIVKDRGDYFHSTQISEDGKRVLLLGEKGSIVEVPQGKTIASFELPGFSAPCWASPDFRTVASAAFQDVDLYAVAEKKVRASLLDHRGQVTRLAFSADGKILVVASSRLDSENREFTNIKLWDTAAGKEIASLPETRNYAAGLRIDGAANRFLLTTIAVYGNRQTEYRVFDRSDGKWTVLECNDAKGRGPKCIAANSSLTLLAAGFNDGIIRLYDIRWPAKK